VAPARTRSTERSGRRATPQRSAGAVALSVLGELILTIGILVLLFIGWQVFINNAISAANQTAGAAELSRSWQEEAPAAPTASPSPTQDDAPAEAEPGPPPVYAGVPAHAEAFATLIVPRFGEGWMRPIAEGVTLDDVLNVHGVGHYPETAMPGAIGNVALAGHRTGWGDTFIDIDKLDVGDPIFIETAEGWYRYEFRSHEYVLPTRVDVLAPVPRAPDVAPTDRILTLTSCNPLHSVSERIIAYSVFDRWYPRADGPPAEIAAMYEEA